MADILSFYGKDDNQVMEMIRAIVRKKGYILTTHAKERMNERNILRKHVRDCLLRGVKDDELFLNQKGEWQVNLRNISSGLPVKLTAIIKITEQVLIITVMRD